VFNLPMVFSGMTVYMDDIKLLAKAKSGNSLLLANHGSRIDWMIGMCVPRSERRGGADAG
jgi:hypothetical protein